MGISAGSMNASDPVYAQPELPGESTDPFYQRWLPGLGLTHVHILPHFNLTYGSMLDGKRLFEDITFPDSEKADLLAIPDESFVRVHMGKAVLFGEGFLIRRVVMQPVGCKGSSCTL